MHGLPNQVNQGRVAIEIRKALTQVDRTRFARQCRHDREDRRTDPGQPGFKHRRGVWLGAPNVRGLG